MERGAWERGTNIAGRIHPGCAPVCFGNTQPQTHDKTINPNGPYMLVGRKLTHIETSVRYLAKKRYLGTTGLEISQCSKVSPMISRLC